MILAASILASAYIGAPTLQVKLGDEWDFRLEQTFVPTDLADSPEDELVFGYQGKVRVSAKKNEARSAQKIRRLLGLAPSDHKLNDALRSPGSRSRPAPRRG